MVTGEAGITLTRSSTGPTSSNREDHNGNEVQTQETLSVPACLSIASEDLRTLESSINAKFAELQNLLHQHDRSMKQMLKAHQNSIKQSVKAQLEKSHADLRQYLDDALQKQDMMFRVGARGVDQESDLGEKKSNPEA